MKHVTLEDRQAKDDFALKAAKHFQTHPHHRTYTNGKIINGALFAIRWGMGDDCVLVFRVHDEEEILIYGQITEVLK